MFLLRDRVVLPLIGLALLTAWPSGAHAEKKHPAEEKGIASLDTGVQTSIKFVNKSKQTIKVYWLDYEGQRKLYETVKDGDSYEVGRTYLGHPWLIADEDDNAWYVYYPDAQPRTVEVVAPEMK